MLSKRRGRNLELRPDVMLYRLNFSDSIYESRYFIRTGNVFFYHLQKNLPKKSLLLLC